LTPVARRQEWHSSDKRLIKAQALPKEAEEGLNNTGSSGSDGINNNILIIVMLLVLSLKLW